MLTHLNYNGIGIDVDLSQISSNGDFAEQLQWLFTQHLIGARLYRILLTDSRSTPLEVKDCFGSLWAAKRDAEHIYLFPQVAGSFQLEWKQNPEWVDALDLWIHEQRPEGKEAVYSPLSIVPFTVRG